MSPWLELTLSIKEFCQTFNLLQAMLLSVVGLASPVKWFDTADHDKIIQNQKD